MVRLALLLAAAVLLCTAPLHAQLVTNGTLTSNASGWTLGTSTACSASFDGGTGNPAGSILLNGCGESDSDPFASQTISGLVVGATYTIQVDVHLHVNYSGGGTGKSFGIFLNSEPSTPLLLTEFLDSSWHTVTTTFVASSTSATIILAGELDARTPGGPGITTDVSYWVDNISVIPPATLPGPTTVPTMSQQALLVLGILLAVSAALALLKRHASRPESL